jgi:hypothetical protein
MRDTSARRARLIAAAGMAAGTVGGALSCLAGASPALLVIVALLTSIVCIAPRVGWALSLPVAIIGLLAVSVVLVRTAPLLGVDLLWAAVIGLVVVGLVSAAAVGAGHGPLQLPGRTACVVAGAALIVPVGFLVVTAVTVGLGAGMHVGWAMNNDAAWNTVSARLILADGGIASWSTPNPSPLANGLMALWYAPGRPEVGALRHDVERQTELLLLMTVLASTVAGVLTARSGVGRRAGVIAVGAVIGGLIPLSWFFSGYVIQFGFFNVVPVITVMLACWMLWAESLRRPVVATTGLLLGTMVLFASWAPVAALPAALALMAGVGGWIRGARSIRTLVWAIGAAALLGGYVVLVTLPDLLRSGHALVADGGAPASTFIGFLKAVAIVVGIAGMGIFVRNRRREALGVAVLASVSIAVATYLVIQRAGMPVPWGYYPAKFAWIVCIVFAVIGAAAAFAWVNSHWARSWGAMPVLLTTAGVALVIGATVTPVAPSFSAAFPLLEVIRPLETADHRSDLLFGLSDGERTIAARLSDEPQADAFANFWLLQLHSVSSDEEIRGFAYSLDSMDAEQICLAVATWDADVRVVTSDESLTSELDEACGELPITVEVRT